MHPGSDLQGRLSGLRVAVSEAIRDLHSGRFPVPRQVVLRELGEHKGTYTHWEDPSSPRLPGLLELAAIVLVTRQAGPLAAMAERCGYRLEPLEEGGPVDPLDAPYHALAQTAEVDCLFTAQLARALEDQVLTAQEAADLISPAEDRLKNARQDLELLKKRAGALARKGGRK